MLTKETLTNVLKTEDFKSLNILKLDGLELESGFKLLLQEFGVSAYLMSLKNNSFTEIDINLGFSNLHKLDLSTNYIVSVGSKDLWSSMPRLQILYLHDNLLETWETFESLSVLPSILHLTLFNNPCIHLQGYRKFMISSLPTLLALDFYISTEEERKGLAPLDLEGAKVWIQDTSDIRNFKQHLYKLKRKWEKCSPIIKIQSYWRRFKVRRNMGGHLSVRDKMAVIIQKNVRGWLLRNKLKRDLEKLLRETNNEHLLYDPEEFVHFKAVKKIESWYKVYKEKKMMVRRRHNASTKISSFYRKWKACRINFPLLSYTKVYILKSQQRTLICLLRALSIYAPNVYHPANNIQDRVAPEFFEKLPRKFEGYSFEELFNRIIDCRSVKVIRFPDLDNLQYTDIPTLQMVKWVPHAKMANSGYLRPLKNTPISKLYSTKAEYEILKKFKNRGCAITKEERDKIKDVHQNLDDYLDLFEFSAPTAEFLHELLLLIFEYNKYLNSKDYPIFIPIYEIFLKRVKAACTVQAIWRGHRVRKHRTLAMQVIERRAALIVQRWWRMIKYWYRINALIKLKNLLKEINSSTLYLQEHLFQCLSTYEGKHKFAEQDFTYFCRESTVYLLNCSRENHKLLPQWVGTQLFIDRTGATPGDEEKTLQAVVLSGARVDIVTLNSQVQEAKVGNPGLKFLKLEFDSVEEAKRRVAVLFLQTLDNRSKSFIPLLTLTHLKHSFLMTRLRSVWKAWNINPNESCPATIILAKALSPIETSIKIEQTINLPPASAPILRNPPSERFFEPISEPEIPIERHTISSQELMRKRVQRAREETHRRQSENKISKQMELEIKMNDFKETKEHHQEIINYRYNQELRQKELKKNMVEAQTRKKMELQNERKFIVQFAQAKNMLQKLMKNSDLNRWKHKSREEIKTRVETFKQKSKERKEFIQSVLFEKYKSKGNKTAIL